LSGIVLRVIDEKADRQKGSGIPIISSSNRSEDMNLYIPTLIVSALLMAACDSPTETESERKADAYEERADMTRAAGESKADTIESADPGLNSESTEQAAEAVRDNSESAADELEDRADMIRQ